MGGLRHLSVQDIIQRFHHTERKAMRYHSTRGKLEYKTFEEAILSAYACDGGLYVPETIPQLPENYRELWKGWSFPTICAEVLHMYSGIERSVLLSLCEEAYKDFNDGVDHIPIHRFGTLHLLDTSLGPTLAFKDVGQQIMGKLINYLLGKQGRKGNIVVETSGDTGPAAIMGVRGSKHINIFCLYPEGRVSDVQELQMITVTDDNVFVYRTDGNTDEQASALKEIFADKAFLEQYNIFSVNSINIGRIIAQSSYFIWCSLQYSTPIKVIIPTGAFGNAMGAYLAILMGTPLTHVVCATNANDMVHRAVAHGEIRMDENKQTVSPAMDIQFAYNLERMLYFISGCDTVLMQTIMTQVEDQYRTLDPKLTALHRVVLSPDIVSSVQRIFSSHSVSDADTLQTMATFYRDHNFLLCPHSATAVHVALHVDTEVQEGVQMVAVLTAHPDKFEATVRQALQLQNLTVPAEEFPSEKVRRLSALPTKFATLRKGDGVDVGATTDGAWRERWMQRLKADIIAANSN